MVFVAVFPSLRVIELIGLRWRNALADAITIEERYCRGDWGARKATRGMRRFRSTEPSLSTFTV
jgi:hypothetical protein